MAWMVEVPKVGVEVVQAKVVTAKVSPNFYSYSKAEELRNDETDIGLADDCSKHMSCHCQNGRFLTHLWLNSISVMGFTVPIISINVLTINL